VLVINHHDREFHLNTPCCDQAASEKQRRDISMQLGEQRIDKAYDDIKYTPSWETDKNQF